MLGAPVTGTICLSSLFVRSQSTNRYRAVSLADFKGIFLDLGEVFL